MISCDEAQAIRQLPASAYTPSAGLAFARHVWNCPACMKLARERAAALDEQTRRLYTLNAALVVIPELARAVAADPEA